MSNFQIDSTSIEFSAARSRNRIEKAVAVIGEKTVKKIIGLALFLLGAKRNEISEMLDLPLGTFFTFLTRFHNEGIDAVSSKKSLSKSSSSKTKAITADKQQFPEINTILDKAQVLKDTSPIKHKVLILSLMNLDTISSKEASERLGLTPQHTRELAHKLEAGDADELIDKRQGQRQDYKFNESVKAELIQQFVFNVITGGSTGSPQLCRQINDACGSTVSERSVRIYIEKLGLNKIKHSLCDMIAGSKKKSVN